MKISRLIPTLLLSLVSLVGCGKDEVDPAQKEACEKFAEHLAVVGQKAQGETVSSEQVDKMVEATVEKCLAAPPKEDEMKCAMAANDLAAMKACDSAPEQG